MVAGAAVHGVARLNVGAAVVDAAAAAVVKTDGMRS